MKLVLVFLMMVSFNAFADMPKSVMEFGKFSYMGISFTDSVGSVVLKGFNCEQETCKKKSQATNSEIVFREGKITSMFNSESYQGNGRLCMDNLKGMKDYLNDTYPIKFEPLKRVVALYPVTYVDDDSKLLGNISTDSGKIELGVACLIDIKSNQYFVQTSISFKDIAAQTFKKDFKYE